MPDSRVKEPKRYPSLDIEEQIDWWIWRNYRPCNAWDAIEGSGLKLIVTWGDVRRRMAEQIAEWDSQEQSAA